MRSRVARSLQAGKWLLGSGLLLWLAAKTNLDAISAVASRTAITWFALSLAIHLLAVAVSTAKWSILLRARGQQLGFGLLSRLYLVGTFFNNFFPSTVGGDVVRVVQLTRLGVDSGLAAASTFLERFIGLFGLACVLPLTLLVPEVRSLDFGGAFGLLAIAPSVTLAVIAVSLLSGRSWLHVAGRTTVRHVPRRVANWLLDARDEFRAYRSHPDELFRSFVLSVVFYLLSGASLWCLTCAIGWDMSIWRLVLLAPVALAVAMVPISVNGLGLLEAGYAWILVTLGMAPADAIVVALLVRARLLVVAAIGGVVFLLPGMNRHDQGTAGFGR